jgi:hypothetical protein
LEVGGCGLLEGNPPFAQTDLTERGKTTKLLIRVACNLAEITNQKPIPASCSSPMMLEKIQCELTHAGKEEKKNLGFGID